MARRGIFVGIGCLIILVGVVFVGVIALAMKGGGLPDQAILAITLDGPIDELVAEDPIAELMGEQRLGLRDLRLALVRAAEDERVVGVRLRIDSFGGGLATAQELRALIQRVRAAGKWTAAYLDTVGEFQPGNMQYYVASACDEISLNPLGDVNLVGFSSRTPFLDGTFDKLGIRAEFPGRGRYKTARFMYTHADFTEEQREMMTWLLDGIMGQLVDDVAASRGLTSEEVRALVDRAPFFGREAVEVRLVDQLEDWTGYCERLAANSAGAVPVGFHRYLKSLSAVHGGERIAVVTAVGSIMRGESRSSANPLVGGDVIGSETIAKAWRDVRADSGVKAAIFRIDSPGGSAVASEVIRQEMARTAAKIPVVVSMANIAGSGGYWITCGAKQILADRGTLTGSIGVFAGHLNLDELWRDKLGVTFGRMDRGANAAIYGDTEDWTDAQRLVVERMLDRIYDDFRQRVADSRGMTVDEVHAVGEGRVFTGDQALERRLVDRLGGFDEALVVARELGGIAPDAAVTLVDFPKVLPWWQQLIERQQRDEVRAEELAALVAAGWQTGRLTAPGAAWMPPIYIR